jgi:hypothetical protein
VARRGLGALPENLQNSLYPVGTLNSNYNDTLSDPMWNTMRQIASVPYPSLPYAGEGEQNPWGTRGGPFYIDNPTVAVNTGGAIISGGGGRRGTTQLFGLGDAALTTPFPYQIKNPFITGNTFWYTGSPVLNKGEPRFVNDAEEFLRSAVVDSDWERVEAWLGWALRNGLTASKLTDIDFGRYKWTGTSLNKKYYPFSSTDYRTFYDRFLRFAATTAPADADCIRSRMNLTMQAVQSSPRNQFVLRLSDCPLSLSWESAVLTMAAMIALPIAIAGIATLAAGAAAGAAAGTTAAVGTAGAAGATGAAVGATAVGIETVTVVASALPVLGAGAAVISTGTALAAGSVIAAVAPPPIAPPEIPIPVGIETVTVTATSAGVAPLVPIASAGAAIGAGTIVATATPPAPVEPTIETVTVEASTEPVPPPPLLPVATAVTAVASVLPPAPFEPIETVTVEASAETIHIDPLEAAATGVTAIALTQPFIDVPEPQLPEIDTDESLIDRVTTGLTDAVSSVGADAVIGQLEQYLQDLLGRPPTPTEVDQWSDWVDTGGTTPPPHITSAASTWAFWILGGVIALAIYEYSRRKKRRKSH